MRISRRSLLQRSSQFGGMALLMPLLDSIRGNAQSAANAKTLFYGGPGLQSFQFGSMGDIVSNAGFYKHTDRGVIPLQGNDNSAMINYFMPKLTGINEYPVGVFRLDQPLTLPYILEPLQGILTDINIMCGLDKGDFGEAYTHHASFTSQLTACEPHPLNREQSFYQAMGESLDSYITRMANKRLACAGFAYNHGEPFAGVRGYGDGHFMSFRNEGGVAKANIPFNTPMGLWNHLFSGFVGNNQAEIEANLRKRQELRLNVMDFWMSDIKAMKMEMSPSEFAHLESYLAMIEQSSKGTLISDINLELCPPDKTGILASVDRANGEYVLMDPALSNQLMDQQIDLLLTALACNVSASGALFYDGSHGGQSLRFLGPGATGFHNMNHGNLSNVLLGMNRFYVEKFARIVTRAKAIPMPDGKNFLDHLVVHWCGEFGGVGDHVPANLPVLMAGKGGGYFKTGQLINYPFAQNKLHGQLLTNIRDAAGFVSATPFGQTGYTGSPLTEVKA
jgi:hypothetical protein